jgi:predicted nucleic acid-binding protein
MTRELTFIVSVNWPVANDGTIYLIDVDVLARIHVRKDSKEIYEALVGMAEAKTLRTVRQTFDELKRFGSVNDILKAHRDEFQIPTEDQFNEDVSALIEVLGNEAAYLWAQTGGKNPDPADPWIVAVAAKHGYTVVTNERPRSTMRIPAACRLPKIDCRCIRGPHFLHEVGIVKEVKPEHIDPASFFNEGE